MEKYINDVKLKKDDMKKHNLAFLFLFLMLGIFCIQLISAEESLGIFKKNNPVRLLQTCSICSYVTLDSVKLPNSTILFFNTNMTQSGSTFYYDFNATDLLGKYSYNTVYGNYSPSVSFEISYTGTEFEIQQSYIYFIALAILILGAIGLGFINSNLSGEHSRGENGNITLINFKGFLKPVILTGIWIIILACIFIVSNLGLAFLPNPMIGSLFLKIYTTLFWITIVAIPVMFVFMLVKIVKSVELQRMIDRGVEITNL